MQIGKYKQKGALMRRSQMLRFLILRAARCTCA
jgi:hypothetical protein